MLGQPAQNAGMAAVANDAIAERCCYLPGNCLSMCEQITLLAHLLSEHSLHNVLELPHVAIRAADLAGQHIPVDPGIVVPVTIGVGIGNSSQCEASVIAIALAPHL